MFKWQKAFLTAIKNYGTHEGNDTGVQGRDVYLTPKYLCRI